MFISTETIKFITEMKVEYINSLFQNSSGEDGSLELLFPDHLYANGKMKNIRVLVMLIPFKAKSSMYIEEFDEHKYKIYGNSVTFHLLHLFHSYFAKPETIKTACP